MQRSMILACLMATVAFSQSAPYTWTPVNPALETARADLCGAALQDGTAILSGGIGTDGNALASVESYQQSTGFGSAPAMNNARARHTCTTLQDGRILVAGGTDGHGNPIGTAEIYDPASQSWYIAADLNDPRWGHTATLLNDGRVLIAGGQDANGPKASLEVFDPIALAFTPSSASLSTSRMNFAATTLPDGLVALMGGSNGANSLSSVDVYDPVQDLVIAGAPLLAARASLSASTLPDGTILAAGGFDGQQDLNTAEIYNVHQGSTFTARPLITARHGHLGMPLPGNGNILMMAGISGGAVLATCELYNFPQGNFTLAGTLASPRARSTVVPVGSGVVLSAGGVSTDGVTPIANSGILAFPSLTWNLSSLPTGTQYSGKLQISGVNFGNSPVALQLAIGNNSGVETQSLGAATADSGAFNFTSTPLVPAGNSGTWTVTATTSGQTSLEATVSQTVVLVSVNLAVRCNPCNYGQDVTMTAAVADSQPDLFPAPPLSGAPISFNIEDLGENFVGHLNGDGRATIDPVLPPGTHSVQVSIANAQGFMGTMTAPVTVTVNQIPTTVSASVSPDPASPGGTLTFQAAVHFDANVFPAPPTGSITFLVNGLTLPVIVGLDSTGHVSLSISPIEVAIPEPSTTAITAQYSGDANYQGSTSLPVTLKIDP